MKVLLDTCIPTLHTWRPPIGPVAGLDRGDPTLLPRLAAMTRVPLAVLARVPLADLIAHPMRPGPRPPACWAICARCLQRDMDQGRVPYVRRAWTHPLAVFCAEHGVPLAPHGHSPIKIASELTLFEAGCIENEPRDAMLETASFDATAMVPRLAGLGRRHRRKAAGASPTAPMGGSGRRGRPCRQQAGAAWRFARLAIRTAALRPEIATGLEPVAIGLVGRRRCRHAAAVCPPRAHGARRASGSSGGGR